MTVTLTAEAWMDMTKAYSAQLIAEFQGTPPEPVKARPYRDGLYTVFSVTYGTWDGQCWGRIEAWRLVPLSLWDRELILSYQEAGQDKTGLRIRFQGKIWVCTEPIDFLAGLPEKRLSMEVAMRCDADRSDSGWRALYFSQPEITWHNLSGHPVSRYREGDRLVTTLFWRYGKQQWIEEIHIADGIALDPGDLAETTVPEQLSIF